MTDGSDFRAALDYMRAHGLPVPEERVRIAIPEAKTVLEKCFKFFLSFQGTEFEWQPEYEKVAEWLTDNQGKGLFLFGDCGRGKSMLVRYVIPAIILRYERKVFTVYDANVMNEKIDEVLTRHIISLDDIGKESEIVDFGNRRVAFDEITDSAEKYGKLLIVSTNLDKTEIVGKYGERVYERVISTMHRIEFKGKSLRK